MGFSEKKGYTQAPRSNDLSSNVPLKLYLWGTIFKDFKESHMRFTNWLRFPGHTFPLNQLIADLSFDFHQPTCLGDIEENIYHLANSRDFDDVPAKNMQKH